jgi:Outer membrane protein beta-barrel domain
MRHKLSVLILILGCFALGAVAWAAPAGTGGRPVAPGLAFLFDKDAFAIPGAQAEPAGSGGVSKFSLKLYGGYNHMLAADVNDGSRYFFDLVDYYVAEGGGTATGGYKPLHGGYDFGGDLIYQITPTLGIGVGAGYMRSTANSLLTYTEDIMSVDITADAMLSAIPLRLGLFLDVPMGGKLNLTANAGAAYYAGLKFDATQGLSFGPDDWMSQNVVGTERSGADIGFHGSLGFEYKFSPKMGFFVEAAGRYAKLKNFKTVTGTTEASDETPDTTVGVLYIVSETIGTQEISMFGVSDTPPIGIEGVREPKFDLSGFSLQAGIRIRF